jgi:hypothetical protein
MRVPLRRIRKRPCAYARKSRAGLRTLSWANPPCRLRCDWWVSHRGVGHRPRGSIHAGRMWCSVYGARRTCAHQRTAAINTDSFPGQYAIASHSLGPISHRRAPRRSGGWSRTAVGRPESLHTRTGERVCSCCCCCCCHSGGGGGGGSGGCCAVALPSMFLASAPDQRTRQAR